MSLASCISLAVLLTVNGKRVYVRPPHISSVWPEEDKQEPVTGLVQVNYPCLFRMMNGREPIKKTFNVPYKEKWEEFSKLEDLYNSVPALYGTTTQRAQKQRMYP